MLLDCIFPLLYCRAAFFGKIKIEMRVTRKFRKFAPVSVALAHVQHSPKKSPKKAFWEKNPVSGSCQEFRPSTTVKKAFLLPEKMPQC